MAEKVIIARGLLSAILGIGAASSAVAVAMTGNYRVAWLSILLALGSCMMSP